MCEELEVSRDAYYKWLKRKNIKNRYELNHESLKPIIQKYYDLSNGFAGSRPYFLVKTKLPTGDI